MDGDRLLGNRRLISGNLSLRGAAIRVFFDDVASPSDHRVNNRTHTPSVIYRDGVHFLISTPLFPLRRSAMAIDLNDTLVQIQSACLPQISQTAINIPYRMQSPRRFVVQSPLPPPFPVCGSTGTVCGTMTPGHLSLSSPWYSSLAQSSFIPLSIPVIYHPSSSLLQIPDALTRDRAPFESEPRGGILPASMHLLLRHLVSSESAIPDLLMEPTFLSRFQVRPPIDPVLHHPDRPRPKAASAHVLHSRLVRSCRTHSYCSVILAL